MSKIILSNIPTHPPKDADKKDIIKKTMELAEKIGLMAEMMFAEKKNSLLVVLQGMDASGKDGVAKSVFMNCPALCIDAYAFKKPTEIEFAHDFLWRIHDKVPAKGQIKLFIRSHYEDILVQRVHKWIDDQKAAARMDAINQFEKSLHADNDTTILKFYLHISHEKQMEKLEERKVDPALQWKYKASDFEESKLWDKYMHYYETAINDSYIKWHIVPSDLRWYRNYVAANIVYETLNNLKPAYPLLLDAGKD